MDMTLLGETTAKLMDSIEAHPKFGDGKILAIGIVCVMEGHDEEGEASTFTRVFCSDEIYYEQVGLFQTGLEVLRHGLIPD